MLKVLGFEGGGIGVGHCSEGTQTTLRAKRSVTSNFWFSHPY